jgi:hypothetical protein
MFCEIYVFIWIWERKKSGSGINIPDPQHCSNFDFRPRVHQHIKKEVPVFPLPVFRIGSEINRGRHLLITVVAGCPDLLPGDLVEPLPAVPIILGYTIYMLSIRGYDLTAVYRILKFLVLLDPNP